jgi:hypothetical protein
VGYVVHLGNEKYIQNYRTEKKELLVRSKCRWEGDIKTDHKEMTSCMSNGFK